MMQLSWIVAIPVLLLLLWLAWRRPNRRHLVWRVFASALAGLSLVLLVFPPVRQQAISPATAVLLTEGYDSDSLKALLQKLEAEPQVYTYKTSSADGIAPVNSLAELQQLQPGLQTVHLLGYGLAQEELQQLHQLQVHPHLSAVPAGLQTLNWPHRIRLGEALEVTGKYTHEGTAATKLYLMAGGKAQDSTALEADSTYNFRLRYTPKYTGNFAYALLAGAPEQKDTLGQLPVQVLPPQELRVLLLASAPSFEFKFLKNHLAELQHKVALRTTISKNISQSEWLNMPKTDLSRITEKVLRQFDAVVTEPEALQALSSSERNALQRAVTETGLGVLTIAAAPVTGKNTSFFTGFQVKRVAGQEARNVRASWAGNAAPIASVAPYTLLNTNTVSSLVAEQGSNLLAGAKKAGWGKVAFSLVPQTFPWQLEGKQEVYASYWANLLTQVARQEVQEKFWQLKEPQVPQPNQPVVLYFTDYTLAGGAVPPAATIISLTDTAGIKLPLAQQVHQPEQFSGTFWPRRNGWHQVQLPKGEPYLFYVQDTTDFRFEGIADKISATKAFAAKQRIAPSETPVAYKEEPVPVVWFFLLFVFSSAYLWLEEKL